MNTPARIGIYAAGLAVVFAASAATAGAIVPAETVETWTQSAQAHGTEESEMEHSSEDSGAGHATSVRGLSAEQAGYLLSEVSAPHGLGSAGELSFRITAPDGEALTDYEASHEKKLHLIVVRSDGSHYRHVHPELGADGLWSLPWTWEAAGTYRVYADFVPADTTDGPDVTLTRTVQVAGEYEPAPATDASTTSSVHGFDVTLSGDLTAGSSTELTAEITRDGEPVTTLEPYLGAFGHLVALREGDLAYLHVHPEGAEPSLGEVSGPNVTFATEAPTPGRYLLYLDFQVDGQVHTATFSVDATASGGSSDTAGGGDHGDGDSGH